MPDRRSPSGAESAFEGTGVIPGPSAPGAFTHQVIPAAGVREGDFAIVTADANPDDFVITTQHCTVGAIHIFMFNIGVGPGNNVPCAYKIFRRNP